MIEFRTFEDILDFAILQEKAAQQFYTHLAGLVLDPDVQLFYRTLAEEERLHEKKLFELKRYEFDLKEPDLESLRSSGYLDAMPAHPEMTIAEAVRYALKKEKSARMLYHTLARMTHRPELAGLLEQLAQQEQQHADFFLEQSERHPLDSK
ncbi:MAG: ferritin family protein [Phycisphaerae bacterium]|nr:ferritin family protein [Phycisphaerae bacterium]